MVTLLLDGTRLEVALSLSEKALAFRKGNVFVERSEITRVQLTEDAWTWLRGVRAPGTFVPGVLAVGTWRSAGGKDFALIRRGRPAVVIDLDGHSEFQRLVITTTHGVALAKALQGVEAGAAGHVEAAAQPEPALSPVEPKPKRTRAPRPAPAT